MRAYQRNRLINVGLTVCLTCSTLWTYAQFPHLRKIPASREIARKSVTCMYQDHQGFMWLGTEDGLYKYDGSNYQPYILPDTALENQVGAIYQDQREDIWVGYQNGLLAKIKDDQLGLFEPREGVPVVAITGITQDPTGTIWISTYGEGLYYYRDQRLYNLDMDDGLAANDIYNLLADNQGTIWAGTDAGISLITTKAQPYQIQNLTTADGLPDNIVKSITTDYAGDVWIGTHDQGICRYDLSQQSIDADFPSWGYGGITSMQWGANLLWIGTENHGLIQFDKNNKYSPGYQRHHDLGNVKILDLLVDREHNLWVSRNDHQLNWIQPGLSFLESSLHDHLKGITALAREGSDRVWFGNDEGLFRFQTSAVPIAVQRVELVDPALLPINCIYPDDDGNVWLGTWNGVFKYHPQSHQFTHYTQKDGLVNNNVLSIAGAEDFVWVATLGGVSRLSHKGEKMVFENYDNEELLGAGYVYHVFVDTKQRAWFGTDGKGLIKWEDQKFTSLADRQPEESKVIYSIVEDHEGHIWFSTPANGVYRYDGQEFDHYGLGQGLRELEINALAIDSQGNLLLVHAQGLDLLNPQSEDVMYFGEESGIENLEVNLNNLSIDEEGIIWIGTAHGIIRFDQWHEPPEMKPTTIIDRTSVFLEATNISNGATLNYSQNNVSFEYVGLWYQNPSEVVYQTRLEGFDLDWNLNKGQISTYPKLPPGDYTFKVRSSITGDFEQAGAASLSFSIDAPFWQKLWFLVLCGIAGLVTLIAIIRYRENRLRGEERLKKELVQTQLETLKSQVNPHFLFNSFNTLAGIIEDDKEAAVAYVEKLSDFFRSSLAFRDRQLITVKEELEVISNYAFLQKKRYGDNLRVQITVNEANLKKSIPPLTLQLLVENAVKHNVTSKDKPLIIKIFDRGNYLYVSNNKQLKQYKADSTGFGLFGIISRYKLITPQPVEINNQARDIYEVGVPFLEETTL